MTPSYSSSCVFLSQSRLVGFWREHGVEANVRVGLEGLPFLVGRVLHREEVPWEYGKIRCHRLYRASPRV